VAGLLAAALVLALGARQGAADIIDPGLDRLKTQPNSKWDLAGDKLPSDFFGPGSDPFDGQIAVLTYTNVWRPAGSNFDDNPDVIPTEIVAMELHSAEPIIVTFNGGAQSALYDVLVTPAPSAPSTGAYSVMQDAGGGDPQHGMVLGGPDSFFDVHFQFEFTPHSKAGPVATATRSDHVVLTADVPWCGMAPAPYYHPMAGGFFPGMPPDQPEPQTMVFQGQAFTWRLRLEPVIPEPATLSLLALGALGVLRNRRRATRDA
jgi:hypothetical protein